MFMLVSAYNSSIKEPSNKDYHSQEKILDVAFSLANALIFLTVTKPNANCSIFLIAISIM